MSRIRQVAMFVVVAALPMPVLMFAGLVQRQNLVWIFMSNLVVAIAATTWSRRPMGKAPGRWSFDPAARR